jgi:hypothetical protein
MGTETSNPYQTTETEKSQSERSRSVIGRILDWLTAGYPEGIPPADRFPVIAILKRRLSDDDVRRIVTQLTAENSEARADGVITTDEIEELISRVVKETPSPDEIRRVSAHLAASGWPLTGTESEETGVA